MKIIKKGDIVCYDDKYYTVLSTKGDWVNCSFIPSKHGHMRTFNISKILLPTLDDFMHARELAEECIVENKRKISIINYALNISKDLKGD